jgi:hypothetical protein
VAKSKRAGIPNRGRILAILLALWLFGCTAFQYQPATPFGVQCPTAPVQTVTVAVRDCCGKIVGLRRVAPAPGQREFVQCRCAEKAKAEHDSLLPPKLEPFFTPEFAYQVPSAPVEPAAEYAYRVSYRSLAFPPSVRPPDAA